MLRTSEAYIHTHSCGGLGRAYIRMEMGAIGYTVAFTTISVDDVNIESMIGWFAYLEFWSSHRPFPFWCPCDNSDQSSAPLPPSFVGNNYFCDGD